MIDAWIPWTFSQRTNLNSEIILHENCTWEFVTRKHVGYSFGWLYFMEKCLKLWHWYGGNTLYQLSLGSFQSNSFFVWGSYIFHLRNMHTIILSVYIEYWPLVMSSCNLIVHKSTEISEKIVAEESVHPASFNTQVPLVAFGSPVILVAPG